MDEQIGVSPLVADVKTKEMIPTLHTHVVLERSDGSALGGYLIEAFWRGRPSR